MKASGWASAQPLAALRLDILVQRDFTMSNSSNNELSTNNTEASDSSPTEPVAATPAEFSLLRVLATVLLLGGLAGGVFVYMTQEKKLPALVEFSGQIFYQGKPLTTGGIFTETIEPGLIGAVGALDSDGRFTLMTNGVPGAYTGRHRLAVSAMSSGSPPQPIVPAHYTQPRTSPLFIDVTTDPKRNTCRFTLLDPETDEKKSQ